MPLQKILLKPGVNRENTRYTSEGGWYESDKIRFRQGTPEKIGGWERVSSNSYQGVCRSLLSWSTITSPTILTGVGTNLKFYIEEGGEYNDITPARAYATGLSGPFAATTGSTTITVTDVAHGATDGDFVTFMGATALSNQTFTYSTATQFILSTALVQNTPVVLSVSSGGSLPNGLIAGVVYYIQVVSGTTVSFASVPDGAVITTTSSGSGTFSLYVNSGLTADVLNQNFQITLIDADSYTITTPVAAGVYDVGTGGTVNAVYEIHIGSETTVPLTGWGAGPWGRGPWGIGEADYTYLRTWYESNFGQDLIFGFREGEIYYWNAIIGSDPSPFTVTIASPGVVTMTYGNQIPDDTAVVLGTTGSLPTGLTAGLVYYVVNSSGSTFELATTPGGSPITTSGTQSGMHSISPRGLPISELAFASDTPVAANMALVSDVSRFVIALGVNPIGSADLDPMFIRWSDQESVVDWTPSVTNQAGGIRLSKGSEIRTAIQTRQEIVVFTDAAFYSMQYIGPPYVWNVQLLGDNTSIAGFNTASVASGVVYWMGVDKFYKYDGRLQTLRCDLRQYIYQDINLAQQEQFFSGTNEGFNEVWWFYCSANSDTIDKYVVYNYAEDIWYYGTLARTAWLDSGINENPLAATYDETLVLHEVGNDDNTSGTPVPFTASITSAQIDIGDGHAFGFVWRLIPDLTFRGSTVENPSLTMTLQPLAGSGSGYNDPMSVGGTSNAAVTRSAVVPIEQFTDQVLIRVRGRQMSMKIESTGLGVAWQLGAPRIDIKPDGRRA